MATSRPEWIYGKSKKNYGAIYGHPGSRTKHRAEYAAGIRAARNQKRMGWDTTGNAGPGRSTAFRAGYSRGFSGAGGLRAGGRNSSFGSEVVHRKFAPDKRWVPVGRSVQGGRARTAGKVRVGWKAVARGALGSWKEALHPRTPKGVPGGGKFRRK